jgi:hypothetical protein
MFFAWEMEILLAICSPPMNDNALLYIDNDYWHVHGLPFSLHPKNQGVNYALTNHKNWYFHGTPDIKLGHYPAHFRPWSLYDGPQDHGLLYICSFEPP